MAFEISDSDDNRVFGFKRDKPVHHRRGPRGWCEHRDEIIMNSWGGFCAGLERAINSGLFQTQRDAIDDLFQVTRG